MLTAGFSGALKGWWDNILTPEQHHEIYNSKKVIKTKSGQAYLGEDDAVYTLISCIVHHFIGHLTSTTDKGREVLQNFKCRTLSHFKWYKDVFITKVMQRPDANNEYWKAKYIDGLPTLFASKDHHLPIIGREKVKSLMLRNRNTTHIRVGDIQNDNLIKRLVMNLGDLLQNILLDRDLLLEDIFKTKRKLSVINVLAKILLNSDTEEDLDYASSSQSEADQDCSCSHLQSLAQMHQINVLTNDQQLMLKNIDQEEDPQTKRYLIKEYLDQFQIIDQNFVIPKLAALIDSGADLNFKNMTQQVILGTPFLEKIIPIKGIDNHGILGQLENTKIKEKISSLQKMFTQEICSDIPTTFWDRHKYIVSLPYIDGFNERTIPTKARPSKMKHALLDLYKKEIQNLLDKKLIRKSYSPRSCTAFYVNKNSKKERGVPRLV
ncbi:uncharacterized protein, partial [Aristolochia californica]|uniref:uncharacterized protein n=1 Tax=Aristolochia californica TaxID=171875 RepID=UPI0035D5A2CE